MHGATLTLPASTRLGSGFDFTTQIGAVCRDMIARLPELAHIDLSRVAISFAQTRKAVDHGMHASLTPMRFENGSLLTTRRRRRYTVQRVYAADGREMLYILTFYLPRFLETPLREKLHTTLHELWHIGPAFDGDLRRFGGRCYAHSHSQKEYDAQVDSLLDRWLALDPPEEVYQFLRLRFGELERAYGRVYGVKIPHPKLLPVAVGMWHPKGGYSTAHIALSSPPSIASLCSQLRLIRRSDSPSGTEGGRMPGTR